MPRKMQKSRPLYAVWLLIVTVLIMVTAVPLLMVFLSAGIDDYAAVASSAVWHQAMLNTLLECVCSSVLSVIIGFIYAYAVVKASIPFRKFFALVPVIHIMTPPFVGGLSFILLLGRQGFITSTLLGLDISLYGFWGLLIAQTLCFFPMAYLICAQTLRGISTNLEDAARSMGAGNFRIFLTVTLPLSATGLLSSLLFIAVSVLSDFGNPLIVAGRFRVLAVEIYTQLTGWLNTGTSAVLGIVLVIPSVILFILQNRLMARNSTKMSTIGGKTAGPGQDGRKRQERPTTSRTADILLFVFVLLISMMILAQFISIIAGSFQKLWGIDTTFTTEHIRAVFKYGAELRNSMIFALISALLGTMIAATASYLVHRTNVPLRKTINVLAQLPSAIPGSLLGLALSITASRIHFRSSQVLITAAMTISFLPFGYKLISSSFSQIRHTLDDGARSLGADELHAFRTVLIPIARGGVFSGFLYSFIRGTGTVSSVIFLISFNTPLTSVRILNLAEQGFWGKAAALALVLTILTFLMLGAGTAVMNLYTTRKKRKPHEKRIKS